MAKNRNSRQKQGNVTHEKLASLPFKTAKALKAAQEAVRLQVWRRLEEAKIVHELIQLDEYKFWHDEFSHGLVCSYNEKGDTNLVRVFSSGSGIEININKNLAEAAPNSEAVLGTLVRAMSESFALTYYRAKGLMPAVDGGLEKDNTKPGKP